MLSSRKLLKEYYLEMLISKENMPDQSNKLYLYEALELRAEYAGRIKTLKNCLPEAKQHRDRPYFGRDEKGQYRPSPELNVSDLRDELKALEYKRRKLNCLC